MNAYSKHYNTIVVGVGGMGSAACYDLAKRGKRAGHRAVRHPARPGLVPRLHAHHPAGLLRAPVVCDAAPARLRAVARDRASAGERLHYRSAPSTPARPTGGSSRAHSARPCNGIQHEVLTGIELAGASPATASRRTSWRSTRRRAASSRRNAASWPMSMQPWRWAQRFTAGKRCWAGSRGGTACALSPTALPTKPTRWCSPPARGTAS